jgi:uncharacterized membrane protein YfcA
VTVAFLSVLVALGVFVGVISALLGIGGGLILIPVLTLFFGIPIEKAIGTGLVSIIATSSAAASVYVQEKLTDIRLGMVLELGTTVGAVFGALVVGYFSRRALALMLAVFLLYSALSMVRRIRSADREPAASANNYSARQIPVGIAGSAFAGTISGLLGIGGGPIKVPLMYLVMGVPLRIATATSNFMIGVTGATSALIYFVRGRVDVAVTAPVVFGVFCGSLLGSKLAPSVRNRYILALFSLLLFYLAVQMFRVGVGL